MGIDLIPIIRSQIIWTVTSFFAVGLGIGSNGLDLASLLVCMAGKYKPSPNIFTTAKFLDTFNGRILSNDNLLPAPAQGDHLHRGGHQPEQEARAGGGGGPGQGRGRGPRGREAAAQGHRQPGARVRLRPVRGDPGHPDQHGLHLHNLPHHPHTVQNKLTAVSRQNILLHLIPSLIIIPLSKCSNKHIEKNTLKDSIIVKPGT